MKPFISHLHHAWHYFKAMWSKDIQHQRRKSELHKQLAQELGMKWNPRGRS